MSAPHRLTHEADADWDSTKLFPLAIVFNRRTDRVVLKVPVPLIPDRVTECHALLNLVTKGLGF